MLLRMLHQQWVEDAKDNLVEAEESHEHDTTSWDKARAHIPEQRFPFPLVRTSTSSCQGSGRVVRSTFQKVFLLGRTKMECMIEMKERELLGRILIMPGKSLEM